MGDFGLRKKQCKKCGKEYPETREFFGQTKNIRGGEVRIGFRGTCRKCMAEHTRNYDQANPDNVKSRIERRVNRQSSAEGIMPKDLPRIRRILQDKCRYCAVDLLGGGEVDHLTPIARGGSNKEHNLTLACAKCNMAKTTKSLEEWLQWRRERGLFIRTITVLGEAPDPVLRKALREP